jgi:hypothetical protein
MLRRQNTEIFAEESAKKFLSQEKFENETDRGCVWVGDQPQHVNQEVGHGNSRTSFDL